MSTCDEAPEVMTMPRTSEQLRQAAEEAERWLDSLDPAAIASPDVDASHLRRVAAAVRAVASGQAELAEAIAEPSHGRADQAQHGQLIGRDPSRQPVADRGQQPPLGGRHTGRAYMRLNPDTVLLFDGGTGDRVERGPSPAVREKGALAPARIG